MNSVQIVVMLVATLSIKCLEFWKLPKSFKSVVKAVTQVIQVCYESTE